MNNYHNAWKEQVEELKRRQKEEARRELANEQQKRQEWLDEWWSSERGQEVLQKKAEIQRKYKRRYLKRRYRQDPVFRAKEIDRGHQRRALYKDSDFPADGWLQLLAAYGAVCMKCETTENLSLDHIEPLSLGGSHSLANSQILCRPCNSAKGNHHSTDYRPFVEFIE